MLWSAGNAPNEMADPVKIEFALHFPFNHLPDKGRLASLLSSGAAPQRLALFSRKPNCERRFHSG